MAKKKRKKSTRGLLGLQGFSNYGIKTTGGELVVFLVQPTNISVLSHANIEVKIRHLLTVLSTHPGLEISCLDSCERFDDNKRFIQKRLQEEDNEAVRKALQQDMAYLDGIQLEMATARQFLFVARFSKGEKPEQVFRDINVMEKNITDRGFEVRRMNKDDIKRVLGIYFESSSDGERVEDVDGANNFDLRKVAAT